MSRIAGPFSSFRLLPSQANLPQIEDDSSLTPISEHQDIAAAVVAGKHQVEAKDFDFGYGLYADGLKVASFAEGRIGYREWARRSGRLGDIHSTDDRFDHDVDELMGRRSLI